MMKPEKFTRPGMLEAILESAVDGIITIDTRGIMRAVNPACERLFGYSEAELVGRNIGMLMPAADAVRHDGYIAGYMSTGERKIIGIGREVLALRKDGATFPIFLSVSTFEVDGERYFTGMLRDISKRVALEAELQRQVGLFQAVFAHVPEPLVIICANHRVLMANPAAAAAFEYPLEEIVGAPASMLFETDTDLARITGRLHQSGSGANTENGGNGANTGNNGDASGRQISRDAAETSRVATIETRLRRKSGASFPGQVAGSLISAAEGKSPSFLLLARDLTNEQKQKEAQLRTQSLEAIGQLTGGVAHDFNNLLTIVAGNLEFAEDYIGDTRGREHVKRARSAVEAGSRLTNRLLMFSRRHRLNSQAVELNTHVLAMTELLQRTLGDDIELQTHLAPALWRTLIDPSEIENAILNLAINARDAMPSGGKLVISTGNATLDESTIGLDSTVVPGEYVRLSVSDTGTGMSKDTLRRAFEPFFTTKPPGRGTGLGLSTIYGFIKGSHGHIAVYSEPGYGTTVNLYLPRDPDAGEARDAVAADGIAASSDGETILVVEDNADVRAVTVGRLQRLGYRVVETETAADALSRLESGLDVDAIFSDIVMPGGVSGFDLARRLALERPHIAVLLTSGFSEGVAPGSTDSPMPILQKPFALADLAGAIRKALSARPRR